MLRIVGFLLVVKLFYNVCGRIFENSQKRPIGEIPLSVNAVNMDEFKPKTKKISQKEKAELLALGLKWCGGQCKAAISIDLFSGLKYKVCRNCSRQRQKKWKEENPEKSLEWRRGYKSQNKERLQLQNQEWINRTRPERRKCYNEWRTKNKEKCNKQRRNRYYKDHEKTKEYFKLWVREQREKNPLFVLAMRIRQRTRYSFVRRKISKNKSTQEMLGCSWEEFKDHIESKFTEGMSWDRFKEIHIDHIIPLASAKTEEELIKLAHYTNLQPLWAKDNMSKGAKM